ncbi:MAG TPA: hypothetical protein VGF19_15900 [Candidatus Acidoferrum sp.]|jgi:hypothetical protein
MIRLSVLLEVAEIASQTKGSLAGSFRRRKAPLLIESGSVLTHLHCLINWEAWTAIGTVSLAVIASVTALYARQQLNDFRRESRIAHLISLVDQVLPFKMLRGDSAVGN